MICREVNTVDSCRDVSALLTPLYFVRRACPMVWALFRGRLRSIQLRNQPTGCFFVLGAFSPSLKYCWAAPERDAIADAWFCCRDVEPILVSAGMAYYVSNVCNHASNLIICEWSCCSVRLTIRCRRRLLCIPNATIKLDGNCVPQPVNRGVRSASLTAHNSAAPSGPRGGYMSGASHMTL